MLQGPHGPFFSRLAQALRLAGHEVLRVGFNRGDRLFWHDAASYRAYGGSLDEWPVWLDHLIAREGITDLVLYGDARPLHAAALLSGRRAGLVPHCFEEGYLRPHWITYERGGTNGHSALMDISVPEMQAALGGRYRDLPEAPPQWGALRHHSAYGALYHACLLLPPGPYRNYRGHRDISVVHEAALQLRRTLLAPARALSARIARTRLALSGAPYHIVLLQLTHDSSVLEHGAQIGIGDFIHQVCQGFAEGAPRHHLLVFKTHPLEDDRAAIGSHLRKAAQAHGIAGRVRLLRSGRLGPMLDRARSAVTINSTAGQQVLWRGLPLKALGRAVYGKPEFISAQPMAEFFADPVLPDAAGYRDYRQYLLETSQLPGSFYTAHGRSTVLAHVVDAMLAEHGPYQRRLYKSAAQAQQLQGHVAATVK
jgi:capsular polysaccharide export protein